MRVGLERATSCHDHDGLQVNPLQNLPETVRVGRSDGLSQTNLRPETFSEMKLLEILRQTGHRSLVTLRRYIREGQLFRAAAAGKLGF